MSSVITYAPQFPSPDIAAVLAANKPLLNDIHPACAAVPAIDSQDFDRLVRSIKRDGLLDPIRINDKRQLLDGRCRISALYVLGIELRDDQVIQADQPAEIIAESNFARRHLTPDQKAMRAVEHLEREREDAAKRKEAGLHAGRKSPSKKKKLVAAATAATTHKRQRRVASLDKVAKELNVPRQQLRSADQVKKRRPDLAKQVANGKLPLAEAAAEAGINRPAPKHSAKPVAKAVGKTTSPNDSNCIFSDVRTSVADRGDGIRVVQNGTVKLFAHADLDDQVVVYPIGSGWGVVSTGAATLKRVELKSRAEKIAISRIKKRLNAEQGKKVKKHSFSAAK